MPVALNTNALITAAELAIFMQTTISDSDYANTLINIASDFIERYCNRKFISQTFTDEQHDGTGSRYLYLKNMPITSVTAVKLWDLSTDSLLYTYTEHTEFTPYLDEGMIYMAGGWQAGHKNYRVTYIAGYAIASVPYDLKSICARIAGYIYANAGAAGIKSESMGNYSVTYDKDSVDKFGAEMPADLVAGLQRWRNYVI